MKALSILILLSALSSICFAQTYSLRVDLKGIRQNKGSVHICLMNKAEQFLRDCYVGKALELTSGARQVTFEALPPGEYAIMAYHDEDNNGKLNTDGAFGLPSEPYAFSNNPNSWFGPPKHRKCVFKVEGDTRLTLEF